MASIIGGLLAQQLIRVVSQKDQPMLNWLWYDSMLGGATVHNIGCPEVEVMTE